MEPTILQNCLQYVFDASLSGITWDMLKTGGGALAADFAKRFSSFFTSQTDAKECLRKIAERPSNSEKYPFDDAGIVYRNIADADGEPFRREFEAWLRGSKDAFQAIAAKTSAKQTVTYGKIEAKNIETIIGIQNNAG